MRKSIVILSFMVLFGSLALLAQAQTANVAGDWEMTAQTQRGPMTWSVNFVQDGEKLTVTMVGTRGETKGEGTIKGNEIQWSVTRTSPQGDQFTITYKGKVEGTTMSGQAERSGGGTMEWTAKKK
jgi:hypothetical protein